MVKRTKPEYFRQISRILQRTPRLVRILVIGLRLTRPKFTAGVVGVIANAAHDVLLVEHVFHPEHPWGLPGGWIERNEAPPDALRREIAEELGLEIEIVKPLRVDTGLYLRNHIDFAYLCQCKGDVSFLSAELLDYRWTHYEAVPRLSPFHQKAIEAASQYFVGDEQV